MSNADRLLITILVLSLTASIVFLALQVAGLCDVGREVAGALQEIAKKLANF
jgi:hypothetical protein